MSTSTGSAEPSVRDLLLPALAWTAGGVVAVMTVLLYARHGLGYDARAYWRAGRAEDPYALSTPGYADAFLYSPVFAQAMRPLAVVPFGVFFAGWALLETAVFWWLTAPLAWRWRGPVLLACVPEVAFGNVYALLALCAVVGFRRPGWWAFPLLTKVTPGAAGLVWFAVRREWRALRTALLWTAGLTAVSVALDPGLWHSWLRFLATGTDGEPRWSKAVRFLAGTALVAWGARSGRRWTVPVALLVLAPHLSAKVKDVSVLAGVPRSVGSSAADPHSAARAPSPRPGVGRATGTPDE